MAENIHKQLSLVYENYVDFVFSFKYTVTEDQESLVNKVKSGEYMYALTEYPLTGSNLGTSSTVQSFPLFAFGISVIYNFPGMNETLTLKRETLSDIFSGTITKWNDAEIAASNPGVSLPDQSITRIVPKNKSPATLLFTQALSNFSSSWTYGTVDTWPSADSSVIGLPEADAVAQYVYDTPYTISYVIKRASLSVTNQEFKLVNARGVSIANTVTSVKSVNQDLDPDTDEVELLDPFHLQFDTINNGAEGSYPIVGHSYVILNAKLALKDCSSAVGGYRLFKYSKAAPSSKSIIGGAGLASFDAGLQYTVDILNGMRCNENKLKDIAAPTRTDVGNTAGRLSNGLLMLTTTIAYLILTLFIMS